VVGTILLKGWHRPTKADPDGRITFELFQSELQASSEAQLLQNAEYLTDVYSYIMDELYPCDNDAIKQAVRAMSETDRQTEETVGNYSRPEGLRVVGHALLRSYAIMSLMHLRDDDARFDITQLIPDFLRMWEKSIDSLKILVLQKEEDEAFFLFLCVMIILHELLYEIDHSQKRIGDEELTDAVARLASILENPIATFAEYDGLKLQDSRGEKKRALRTLLLSDPALRTTDGNEDDSEYDDDDFKERAAFWQLLDSFAGVTINTSVLCRPPSVQRD